jgi:large subunit ribosomal protein L27
MGRDYTIFAKIDGIVRYERVGKDRKRVSVYPKQAAATPAPAQ